VRKPKGHIRKRPFGYEIAVPEGRDPITKRYRYRYAYADTTEEAETERQRLVGEVTSGRKPRTQATFGQLLDEVIKVTDLDPQTTYTYGGYIERTIRPALGTIPVRDLEERPELIDRLYAERGADRTSASPPRPPPSRRSTPSSSGRSATASGGNGSARIRPWPRPRPR
jgi:integrase